MPFTRHACLFYVNPVTGQNPSSSKFIFSIVLGALLVAAFDRVVAQFLGEQTIAPLAALILLACFSTYLSPPQILISIPILAIESFVLIREVSAYPYVRTATVALGGILAWVIRRERLRVHLQVSEMETLLAQLPSPWLLIDSSGNILQASRRARTDLGMTLSELQATSFSYLFSPAENKGGFIQTFLNVVDQHQGSSHIEVVSRKSGIPYSVSLAPLTRRQSVFVLAVFSPLRTV